jgi:hypothetical protein
MNCLSAFRLPSPFHQPHNLRQHILQRALQRCDSLSKLGLLSLGSSQRLA